MSDELRERCIAVNSPCFLMIDNDERVDFPDLPALMVDKTFQEIRRDHYIQPRQGAFVVVERARWERVRGDAGRWRHYCVTGGLTEDGELQLCSREDLEE